MISFKIWPNRKKDQIYWVVQIFDTKKEMYEYCKKNCDRFMGNNTAAICHNFFLVWKNKDGKVERLLKQQGTLHFYRGRIGISIVSHECIHAAMDYVLSIRKKPITLLSRNFKIISKNPSMIKYWATGVEEALCLVAGNLIRQCVIKLYEKKVWP